MYVALYSILIRRYKDISSKADWGDIFIRAAAGQMGVGPAANGPNGCCWPNPKQDFIVVPPPSNIMAVKK